jgi:hypothetical protein
MLLARVELACALDNGRTEETELRTLLLGCALDETRTEQETCDEAKKDENRLNSLKYP